MCVKCYTGGSSHASCVCLWKREQICPSLSKSVFISPYNAASLSLSKCWSCLEIFIALRFLLTRRFLCKALLRITEMNHNGTRWFQMESTQTYYSYPEILHRYLKPKKYIGWLCMRYSDCLCFSPCSYPLKNKQHGIPIYFITGFGLYYTGIYFFYGWSMWASQHFETSNGYKKQTNNLSDKKALLVQSYI